jgi:regulator of sigma E protease
MNLPYIFSILLLVFGFGFVIFWHELGHFLAAKWVGVRVEQFAVGFGHAILAWRKGIGLRVGTTQREYDKRVKEYVEKEEGHLDRKDHSGPTNEQLTRAAEKLGLGETEYRLNWIPLGGYVKMLGQDDLNPNSQSDDPRAFNRKSIPARMLVVSAGVIMNVFLAAIGFMVVFMIGFNVPPAKIGGIVSASPAQAAGVRVGDEIWTYDGKRQYDWTKVQLNVALSGEGEQTPLEVKRRVDGEEKLVKLTIVPRRDREGSRGFLNLGIYPPRELAGVKDKEKIADDGKLAELVPAEQLAMNPGDTIVAINGEPVDVKDYPRLDRAVQSSYGAEVILTVKDKTGKERAVTVRPQFAAPFGTATFNLLGMAPRATVAAIEPGSSARGKLRPGDAVASLSVAGDPFPHPTVDKLVERLKAAGEKGDKVDMTVVRDGQTLTVTGLEPNLRLQTGGKGLGIGPGFDGNHAIVGGIVSGSPAEQLGVLPGSTVVGVNGKDVQSWFDVHRELSGVKAGENVALQWKAPSGEGKTAQFALSADQFAAVHNVRYTERLELGEPREPRKAENVMQAMGWGVTETRDFILQFYLTLRRMADGTVSPANLMGPIGIFHAGTKFAYKGHDWLIWFLAMISANLAVVNFLPIPIVDGGLFTFLILEKIKGKPLSAKTQTIAQFVGMAVLLCVFLLVTYQDIARLTFMR